MLFNLNSKDLHSKLYVSLTTNESGNEEIVLADPSWGAMLLHVCTWTKATGSVIRSLYIDVNSDFGACSAIDVVDTVAFTMLMMAYCNRQYKDPRNCKRINISVLGDDVLPEIRCQLTDSEISNCKYNKDASSLLYDAYIRALSHCVGDAVTTASLFDVWSLFNRFLPEYGSVSVLRYCIYLVYFMACLMKMPQFVLDTIVVEICDLHSIDVLATDYRILSIVQALMSQIKCLISEGDR